MRCSFCGHEFEERQRLEGCKGCLFAYGCKMIKCPRCNYENAPGSIMGEKIIKYLKDVYRRVIAQTFNFV